MRNENHFNHLNIIRKNLRRLSNVFMSVDPSSSLSAFFSVLDLQGKSETESEKMTARDDPVKPPQAKSRIPVTRYVSI